MAYPIIVDRGDYFGAPLMPVNNMHIFLKLFPRKIKGKRTVSQRIRSNRRKK